jgi:hypothetical protein
MQYMDIIMFFDFMHILNNIRKHPTNNEYFLIIICYV